MDGLEMGQMDRKWDRWIDNGMDGLKPDGVKTDGLKMRLID